MDYNWGTEIELTHPDPLLKREGIFPLLCQEKGLGDELEKKKIKGRENAKKDN